eukprot:TRINITY_DN9321_c0_g1_i1.p1 TRINITY_DN9321_c0_g1~~TRINITY_DN9321_c0_g1_i1.p1  ORF type:complete len:967 (+),score=206.76 TRINITY_DN9321_c0_g1_i1:54-2903(+)
MDGTVLGGDLTARFGVARFEVVGATLHRGGHGVSSFTEVRFSHDSNEQIARTEVCARSQTPVWEKHSRFAFNVSSKTEKVHLAVYHRRLFREHRLLGEAELTIGGLHSMRGDRWVPLKPPAGTWTSVATPGELHVRWVFHYCMAGDLLLGTAELGEQGEELEWSKLVLALIRVQGHISRLRNGPWSYVAETCAWKRPVRTVTWLSFFFAGLYVAPILLSVFVPAGCLALMLRSHVRHVLWVEQTFDMEAAAADRERQRAEAVKAVSCTSCSQAFVRFVNPRVICGHCGRAFCNDCCHRLHVVDAGADPARVCERCSSHLEKKLVEAMQRVGGAARAMAGAIGEAPDSIAAGLQKAAKKKQTVLVGAVKDGLLLSQQLVHTVGGLMRGNAASLVLSPEQEVEMAKFQTFCRDCSDWMDEYVDIYLWRRFDFAFGLLLGTALLTAAQLWGFNLQGSVLYALLLVRIVCVPARREYPVLVGRMRAAVSRVGWQVVRRLEQLLWELPVPAQIAARIPKSTEQQVEEALPKIPKGRRSYEDWKSLVDSRELMRELVLDKIRVRDVCSQHGLGGAACSLAAAANPSMVKYSAYAPGVLLGELWDMTGGVVADDIRGAGAQVRGGTAQGAVPAVFEGVVGGVARGTAGAISWVKRTVRTPLDALEGSGGQQTRRASPARGQRAEPTRGLVGSVGYGAKNLVTETVGGVAGVFVEPVRGAQQRGIVGFVSGVGKGLVGAVTRPVTGTLDMLEGVCTGFANDVTSVSKAVGGDKKPKKRVPLRNDSPATPTAGPSQLKSFAAFTGSFSPSFAKVRDTLSSPLRRRRSAELARSEPATPVRARDRRSGSLAPRPPTANRARRRLTLTPVAAPSAGLRTPMGRAPTPPPPPPPPVEVVHRTPMGRAAAGFAPSLSAPAVSGGLLAGLHSPPPARPPPDSGVSASLLAGLSHPRVRPSALG